MDNSARRHVSSALRPERALTGDDEDVFDTIIHRKPEQTPQPLELEDSTRDKPRVLPDQNDRRDENINELADIAKKRFQTVVACSMFMACSASMMLVNKQVVIRFHTPVTILDMQLLFTVLVLGLVFPWTLQMGTRQDIWRWVRVVPMLYAGMLSSSMIAQLYATVGLQVAIRNLGPLITLPVERVFNEPIVTDKWTWGALLCTLVGIILYVSESLHKQDLNELAMGILLSCVNLLVAMFERLFQRNLIAVNPVDISKTGMLILNNMGAVVPVTLLLTVPGLNGGVSEPTQWRERWPKASVADYSLLLLSGICGMAIGWTAINAQQYVTATTMLLITNLNKILVVTVGMVFMGDPHGPVAVLGMMMALGGGVWYALARSNIAARQREAKYAADRAMQAKELAKARQLQADENEGVRATKTGTANVPAITARAKQRQQFSKLNDEKDEEAAVMEIPTDMRISKVAFVVIANLCAITGVILLTATMITVAAADDSGDANKQVPQPGPSRSTSPALRSHEPPALPWYVATPRYVSPGMLQPPSPLPPPWTVPPPSPIPARPPPPAPPQHPLEATYSYVPRLAMTMSSTYLGLPQWTSFGYQSFYGASMCMDASTNTFCHTGGHTDNAGSDSPWLSLELEADATVSHVLLENRRDCCQEELGSFEVWVGEETAAHTPPAVRCVEDTANEDSQLLLTCGARGRFVTLVLPGNERTLHIAEMYALTPRRPSPPPPPPAHPSPPPPPPSQPRPPSPPPSPPPPPQLPLPVGPYNLHNREWEGYRLGDMVLWSYVTGVGDDGEYFQHLQESHITRWPHSLAAKYLQSYQKPRDFETMTRIIRDEPSGSNTPASDEVVVHLRVGDVIEDSHRALDWMGLQAADIPSDWNIQTYFERGLGTPWEVAIQHYIMRRPFYEEHLATLRAAGVRKATFVAGSHLDIDFTRSSQYIDIVREFFYHHGFQVQYRLGAPADEDFIFLVRAKFLIQSGGGYSALAAELNKRMGGTVLCSGKHFSCSLDGTVKG